MSDWIIGFITDNGYLGIFLMMLAENVFPPIPSELIMPFAGLAAARGDLMAGEAGLLPDADQALVGRQVFEHLPQKHLMLDLRDRTERRWHAVECRGAHVRLEHVLRQPARSAS